MTLSRGARATLTGLLVVGLVFMYVPLLIVLVNSFNVSRTFNWPPTGFTLEWWSSALQSADMLAAFRTSIIVAAVASTVSIVLGTMLAFAIGRYQWFGRESVSFLVVLPIALPGIVTGVSLSAAVSTLRQPVADVFGVDLNLGMFTTIVGHVTFTIVIIYNNALARLRRMAGSVEEASMDLGADTFQTFRFVTFPAIRGALVAGALLAFGLSFDEIIVTRFVAGPGVETLPLWIFNNLFRPYEGPVVNAVAALMIVLAVIPIWASQRLSSDESSRGGGLI